MISRSLQLKQKGVALIQVLLISAVISILAIRFSLTAREQIAMSTAFEQRVKANLILQSVQSKVIYSLFTLNDYNDDNPVFPTSEKWNFYGKPFVLEHINNTQISAVIQDNNGLLSQYSMNSDLWSKALENLGLTDTQIKKKQGEITDWKDKDTDSWLMGSKEKTTLDNGQRYRNQPIQLSQEIALFFSKEPQVLNLINQISTHYPTLFFNPMNAPNALLSLILDPSVATEIIRLRSQNELTTQYMLSALGNAFDYDQINMNGYYGNSLKITIQVKLNDIKLQETIEIILQKKNTLPILILSRY